MCVYGSLTQHVENFIFRIKSAESLVALDGPSEVFASLLSANPFPCTASGCISGKKVDSTTITCQDILGNGNDFNCH